MILAWLTSGAGKWLALGVLVAALIAYRALLVHQRDAAVAQAAQLRTQLTSVTVANQAMQAAVTQQNAAVAALRKQAAAATQQAAAQAAAATQAGTELALQAQAQAASLKSAVVPSDCAGAIAWGNAQGAELGKW
jgi:hypothetical protein